MNIGILTFHKTDNYGAMLQAYALSSYLNKLGHQAHFIDYCPEYVYKKRFIHKGFIEEIKGTIKKLLCKKVQERKAERFAEFIRLYIQSIPVQEASKLDLVILGSDQIWATNLTDYDSFYMGNGIKCNKIVSYAASCGNLSNMDEKTATLYKTYLNKLTHISVRERKAQEIISSLMHRQCSCVLDPTLLVDNSVFSSIHRKPTIKDYILVYDGTNPTIIDFADRLSKKLHKKVVAISCDIALKNQSRLIQDASVEEFLGYIANAAFVISTSFHGCALSLSYRKDFYCINTGGVASRSAELLALFDLRERFIDLQTDVDCTPINYKKVDKIWAELRVDSKAYLSACLE